MKRTRSMALGMGALLLGLAGLGLHSAAYAADAGDTLEEVVVTAERQEENIQKTPINVTVISGESIQQQGLTDMQEILENLPGVTVQGQLRGFDITVRGLGTDLPPGSAQGAVAYTQDGVYDIRAESGTVGYYDLQRIEVLAGPQGTLYGVNSDGGVVSVLTNNPQVDKFSASGSLSLGNYNLVQGQAALNLPVGSNAALRFAATAINRDGFLDTGASDDVSQGGRVKYLWQPSERFSLLLGYEVTKIGGLGAGTIAAYQNGNCHYPYNPYTGSVQYIANCWSDVTGPAYGVTLGGTNSADTVQSDADQWVRYHSDKYWAEIKWNLGFANLSFTPSYKTDYSSDFACGMGLCTLGGDPAKLQQNSEEVKLTQASGSPVQWSLGLYHWGYEQLTTGSGPSGSVYQTTSAAFGEITYPLGEALRLKAGVRESQDWKNETGAPSSLSFNHLDYRGGLEYDLAPQSMLYGTIATGYRPGGYNTTTPVVTTYKTEQVTDYEVGIKNRFWDNRLQVNADAFYYDYKNYQLLDFYAQANLYCNNTLNPPGPPVFDYENFQARNMGADLSVSWQASERDKIDASAAYLNNKFTGAGAVNYNPVTNCQAYLQGLNATEMNTVDTQALGSNTVQPHSPTLSGSLSYEHRFALSDGAYIALRPAMRFSEGYYVNPLESTYSWQPTFEKYDLTGTFSAADGKWTLAVWGRNLGDYAEKSNFVAGTASIGEPRTVGITLSGHL